MKKKERRVSISADNEMKLTELSKENHFAVSAIVNKILSSVLNNTELFKEALKWNNN